MKKQFKIPAGATSLSDCSGLIPKWINHLDDLNIAESMNIASAQRKYLLGKSYDPSSWFKVSELKLIHKSMFNNVWEWAGAYRKSITSIGIKPGLIPSQLAELCFQVLSWLKYPVEFTYIEMAARIHHRLVFIHPFENGNGRFSRLIADRFLISFKCKNPFWPINMNKEGLLRNDYIQTLQSADRGDYNPLINFMIALGAKNPNITELIGKSFYKNYVQGEKGAALVCALLKGGCNPNEENIKGYRALQLSIKAGLVAIVKLLVSSGADINFIDKSGLTPFQLAVAKENKVLSDYLLTKGAAKEPPPGSGYSKFYKLYGD